MGPSNPSGLRAASLFAGLAPVAADEAWMERAALKLFAHIGETVTVVDEAGAVLATSAVERGDLGYDTNSWLGRNLLDLVHPDDRAEMAEQSAVVLAAPATAHRYECRLRRADGGWHPVAFTAVNLIDDPDIGGVVITAQSLAERRDLEQRVSELSRETLAVAQAKTEYVAAVSHEVRAPLHTVIGMAELLEDTELSADARRLVEAIGREARSLRALIDDVLDFSKLDAGRTELFETPFSPARVVGDAVESFRDRALTKGVELQVRPDPALPRLMVGDVDRIRQIVTNLVGNAVKYTAHGAVVTELGVAPGGGLEVSVSDTGVGIPHDAQNAIWEPFSQVHGAGAARQGTGLGLAIVRRLVKAMSGELSLRSHVGVGSTFTVTLPLADADDASHSPGEPSRPPSQGSGAILVVEDSPANQLLATAQLTRLGYESIVVASGEEGLDLLAEPNHGFAVVLMDWHLGGMDGLETTRRLRDLEVADRRVPVVAMTANATAADREVCLAAGMDDFLAKPVLLSSLAEKLDRWTASTSPDAMASVEDAGVEVVDERHLAALVDDVGDRSIVVQLVGTFLGELEARMAAVDSGADEPDEVHRAAHTIKSTAAMLGAVALSEAAARVEQLAPEGPVDELDTSIARLRREAGAAAEALRGFAHREETL